MRRERFFFGARSRILASYAVLLLFSTLVGGVALNRVLTARAGQRVDNALVQESKEFRRLVELDRNPRTGRSFAGDVRATFDVFLSQNVPNRGESFFTFLDGRPYRTKKNRTLRPPRGIDLRPLSRTSGTRRGELESLGDRFRYLAVPVRTADQPRGVLVIAINLEARIGEVNQALRLWAGVSIGVLLLASVLAWTIAGRVLAPLRMLSDTARSISETDLTARIPAEGADELAELARTFNAMLDRLEGAFASQKAFISDAGHELRTPITIIRGHLELLGQDPDERRETLALVTDELDRMSRFVDDLLLLAKAQRPDFLQLEELDLDVLARELFAKASALAPRDWHLEADFAGTLRADRQRLTQAVMNLAQNAVKHTRHGDRVVLEARLRDDRVRLSVRDFGPGVHPADRERIFERFVKGSGTDGGDGAGLGLAIARAIAEAHGGSVDLEMESGPGARFTVSIPTDPPGVAAP